MFLRANWQGTYTIDNSNLLLIDVSGDQANECCYKLGLYLSTSSSPSSYVYLGWRLRHVTKRQTDVYTFDVVDTEYRVFAQDGYGIGLKFLLFGPKPRWLRWGYLS